MTSAAPEAADGEDVLPQRNLHVALLDVGHFNGKQETRVVFLDLDVVNVLQKGIRLVGGRHAVERACRHWSVIEFGRGFVHDSDR